MKKTYKAQNINCINCSNLIKGSLEDEFGEIAVNLEAEPKEVTVEIKDEKSEAHFINEMADIGFDIIDE
ncbi:MAG TPA: heavy metal transport/detoxification protein [Sulfurospirillum arcachonense]|nr:heavy metal transport/detoxification protein [Sulfurospirillum arcachonense]